MTFTTIRPIETLDEWAEQLATKYPGRWSSKSHVYRSALAHFKHYLETEEEVRV